MKGGKCDSLALPEQIVWGSLDTPLGRMCGAVSDQGVLFCDFEESPKYALHRQQFLRRLPRSTAFAAEHPLLTQWSEELTAYFIGTRQVFEVPLAPLGTPFQQEVWHLLKTIPYGETLTYAGLAQRMGQERAVRAVAAATAGNPLLILIPCHRLVASNGTLGGYSAGGDRKAALLVLERTGRR